MIRTNAPKITFASGLAALALISAAPATADETSDGVDETAEEMTKGEARLAKMLEGRVAGEPLDCITDFRNSNLVTIDNTAYVYGRGRTIYVQRTNNPENIDRDNILVIKRHSSTRLCRLDFMRTIDRYAGFFTGGVQFTQFVPYTKVDEAKNEAR